MDEAVHIILSYCLGDPGRTFDVDILQRKVPASPVSFPVAFVLGRGVRTSLGMSDPSGCRRRPSVSRPARSTQCFVGRIPRTGSALQRRLQMTTARTRKATLPRSPGTLRCRLAISSLYGITTWHPTRAVRVFRQRYRLPHGYVGPAYPVGSRCTAQAVPLRRIPSRCVL